MLVWIIQIGEPLLVSGNERKMRSNLLAEELAGRGHEVILWVSAFDHNARKWAIESEDDLVKRDGIRVRVLRGAGYRKNVSFARYLDHRLITWRFRKQVEVEEKPDVVIASLPPHDLACQCVKYACGNDVPVVVDIRDLWPDIFLDRIPKPAGALARLLLFNDFRMVKKALSRADGLMAVSNSFLEWGLGYADRPRSDADRVFHLGYHRLDEEVGMENVGEELSGLLAKLNNRHVVTYIGTFSEAQGPSVMTESAKLINDDNIMFVFTGYGERYEQARAELAGRSNVNFVGWLNQNEIDALLARSSIGICPYGVDSSIFPNKACMYLSAGIPVVSSYQGDLKDLIETERIGFNLETGDAGSMKDAILFLSSEKQAYEEMSRNARALFEARFVEESIYRDYADAIEHLVARKAGHDQ